MTPVFEVWAPQPRRVRLWLGDPPPGRGSAHAAGGASFEMHRDATGWWRCDVPDSDGPAAGPAGGPAGGPAAGHPGGPPDGPAGGCAGGPAAGRLAHGADYGYLLDDGHGADLPEVLPDPRSAWQPAGVHGPSRTYDHSRYQWQDDGWRGRPLAGAVLYELHVGTFTPEGTFDAAVERLDHLVDLGVDLVEVMPVNAFNGPHGWGYDGVCWYAVHEPYGGPDGFKRFVDACHARGLGVVLDVVYNHLGPSGAYLTEFGPYLTAGETTWGQRVNLDGPDSDEVRRHIVDNACGWLRDYHLDGLRLDAVHALHDTRAVHLLEELAAEVATLQAALGRPLSLIAESDLNDPRLVTPREAGGYGLTAAWNDDVHHAVHAALTGERQGYYADFGSMHVLGKALSRGYVHDGGYSTFRRRGHGRPVDPRTTTGDRFVVYLQNHDQVGNRALGDRISAAVPDALLRVGATLILTAPYTPMLFMGEEWTAGTPWQYFTSHPEPELAEAVGIGRRTEFSRHGWGEAPVPDPQDPATHRRSCLDWDELDQPRHRATLEVYRSLIALRKRCPDLTDPRLDRMDVAYGERWLVVRRGGLAVAANLGPEPVRLDLPARGTGILFATGPGTVLEGDGVRLPGESAVVVRLGYGPPGEHSRMEQGAAARRRRHPRPARRGDRSTAGP